jgi:nucleoside-diphosphate-sugar epimerase
MENVDNHQILIQGDIRNTEYLEGKINQYQIEIIIHLAAITSLPVCESNPAECILVNVGGTASVLDAARTQGCKVIFASTSAIYEANTKEQTPFEEQLETNPKLMYPLSKKLAEQVVQSYIDNYGMDVTTLRFFNVFGPRQDIHRKMPPLVNYIVRSIKNGDPINFYSDGYQQRDYVHVDDVANLIEKCLTAGSGEVFNVCTGTLTSVRDIISYAEEAFGPLEYTFNPPGSFWSGNDGLFKGPKPLKKEVVEREVNKFALGSCQKAEKLLKWVPDKDIRSLMVQTMLDNMEILS